MFEINMSVNNINHNIKHKKLSVLSELFIKKLEDISKTNDHYKDIIVENKIKTFSYTMTNKAIENNHLSCKSKFINYEYQNHKSVNEHFTQITSQLKSLKIGFEKENIAFDFILTPSIWSSIPRKNKQEEATKIEIEKEIKRNLLYFGAPGTGKSFEVENLTKNNKTFRTMFHEEYSYFDFIGQYKPMVSEKSSQGSYKNARGESISGKEPVILYDYVAGDFIKAYIEAKLNPNTRVFFIIEEINS